VSRGGQCTSVASALTAETVFEIIKCMSDVLCLHACAWVKVGNFEVFQFWLRPRQKYLDFSTGPRVELT